MMHADDYRNPLAEHTKYTIDGNPAYIDRFTYGAEYLTLLSAGEGAALHVGSFCSIAPSVTIFLGANHRTEWMTTFPFGHIYTEYFGGTSIKGHPCTNGDVIIGHDVWLAMGSTVMSGVTIGNGAIIAANAHVVKNVKPYEIVGGNPAKHIGFRFAPEIIERLQILKWWLLPVEDIKELAPTLSTEPTVAVLDTLIAKYRPEKVAALQHKATEPVLDEA